MNTNEKLIDEMGEYNGWNVALWIGNDAGLCNYREFAQELRDYGSTKTLDGLDHDALDEMMGELRGG